MSGPLRVRIVSDGTGNMTRVLNADGQIIPGVTRVEIGPIRPGGLVTALITIGVAALDVQAMAAVAEVPRFALKGSPTVEAAETVSEVCAECAVRHGGVWLHGHIATISMGTCQVCDERKPVSSPALRPCPFYAPLDNDAVRVADGEVWLRHPDGVFRRAFTGRPGETDAAVYARWKKNGRGPLSPPEGNNDAQS